MHIDIDYDPARAVENQARWDAAFQLSVLDRPPIGWGAVARMMLHRRRSTFTRLFSNPVEQLHELILNHKWIAENLPGDMICGLDIVVQPQFENASNSNAFGCPIQWFDEQSPQALHCISTLDELANYSIPPFESTLWQRMIDYYHGMKEYLGSGQLKVTMRGEPVSVQLQLHVGGESPFLIASDLIGPAIYEWIYEAPDEMHRLLEMITDHFLATEKRMREICGCGKTGRIFLTDDAAQIISLEAYREYCVPYTGRLYDQLTAEKSERIMHLCGRHTHFYPALLDDLNVAGIWGYGSKNTPQEVAEGLGGRMWLLGNLDPILLFEGPTERIAEATQELLDHLLPCGGMIVGDGYNLVPETPIEHLRVVEEVVKANCGVKA